MYHDIAPAPKSYTGLIELPKDFKRSAGRLHRASKQRVIRILLPAWRASCAHGESLCRVHRETARNVKLGTRINKIGHEGSKNCRPANLNSSLG